MDAQTKQIVAIFDLDSTITSRDTHIPFYLVYLKRRPMKWLNILPVVFASARYLAGDKDRKKLKQAFLKAFMGGVGIDEARSLAADYARYWMDHNVYPGALARIAWHKSQGHPLILATASYSLYAGPMADILGFDHVIGTEIELDADNRIVGKLIGENCRGSEKRDRVLALLSDKYPSAHKVFYSDDKADAPLLEAADEAFMVNPDPKSMDYGVSKGFAILDWRTADQPQDVGSV